MPYVDQGEPKPATVPPILPIAALILAIGLCVWLWGVFWSGMNNGWLPPLITGAIIGAALRFTGGQRLPRPGLIAILATLLAGAAGYSYRHMYVMKWTNTQTGEPLYPDFNNAMSYLFNDMQSFLLIAVSAYIAYVIVSTIPYTVPQADPTRQP